MLCVDIKLWDIWCDIIKCNNIESHPILIYYFVTSGGGGMSNICKHFITHGCRLGTACRFLHITPEELAVKMSQERNDSLQADNRTSTFTKT
jgi:hypothetical protein